MTTPLRQMEASYIEHNEREYELTKHISLAMLDPIALLELKEEGECYVYFPETAFDLDRPGDYFRRIKSVSLTIPCVTGPYTNVNCRLTLMENRIRTDASTASDYAYDGPNDTRFQHNSGAVESIATSSAQNDSGMFELNFRDERYLRFEGAGAISHWRLEMPTTFKSFDYDTISDVIFHINYRARDGGDILKSKVTESLQDALNQLLADKGQDGLLRMFSVKHEFPSEWSRFLNPGEDTQSLELELTQDHFPYMFKDKTIAMKKVELFLKPVDDVEFVDDSVTITLKAVAAEYPDVKFNKTGTEVDDLPYASPFDGRNESIGAWSIEITGGQITADAVEDMFVVILYNI